eukprot:CAMPEP_0119066220 /NCGR_PEP_ID=MMETSP1178-20130426/8834_1 /TAXON_ID=33656 /ORGANISM="unid sp, Strain CCMP2000" /LENGTH=214 /DNA_ID=CAMNT_0007047801 /DNA_START=44 /DNA_END=688 /DNA_ORIENTATION=+
MRGPFTRVARVVVIVLLLGDTEAKKSAKKKKRQGDDFLGNHGCKFNLEPHKPKDVKAFFVCDTTASWLKAVSTSRGSEWTEAMPTKGTGCHEYAFYEGVAPKGCTVGKRCAACARPEAKYLKSEHYENYASGSCSGSCAPKSPMPAATATSAADDGDNGEDDEEERRIWGSAAAKPKGYRWSMEDGWAWTEDGEPLRHHKSEMTGIEYTSKVEL